MRARRIIFAPIVLAAALANTNGAGADDYPSRPITIVVPFAAGGPTDTIARIVAERMSLPLKHSLVIENITGAAGTIGVGRVARASADGYTLTVGYLGTHVLNGAIYSLQYDVLKDFARSPFLPATRN
jgi:tripartite-type tricarboxylate transporter receptor subunit TctC